MVSVGKRQPRRASGGFALLVVLWVVAILSAVSFALIESSRAEARNTSEEWDRLVNERLARSGQEVETYLRSKNLGLESEDLSSLPVGAVTPGLHYTIRFPEGPVDLFVESDLGRLSASAADNLLLQNFLTRWKNDAVQGALAAEGIIEWRRQNNRVGIAELLLIPGLTFEDFQPKLTKESSDWAVRESLDEFLTYAPTATQINPNFAPKLVLLSIPGVSAAQVQNLLLARKQGKFFRSADELGPILSLPPESPAWHYFRFDNGLAPAVLTIAGQSGRRQRSERRIYEVMLSFNAVSGSYSSATRLHRIQFDHLPQFLREIQK